MASFTYRMPPGGKIPIRGLAFASGNWLEHWMVLETAQTFQQYGLQCQLDKLRIATPSTKLALKSI
jgi:hypothetical protein